MNRPTQGGTLWPKRLQEKQGFRCQHCNRRVFNGWLTQTGLPFCRECYPIYKASYRGRLEAAKDHKNK